MASPGSAGVSRSSIFIVRGSGSGSSSTCRRSEGCTSILWRDGGHAQEAAEALRLTAQDLQRLGVVDRIVTEPLGGAQRAPKEAVERLGEALDLWRRALQGEDDSNEAAT